MKIAIKANPDRGKEIISLLESFGGINRHLKGDGIIFTYYIGKNNIIKYDNPPIDYKVYTLEEFEKEFPFKVGDEVIIIGLSDFPKVITQMTWDCGEILYSFEGLNNTWFGAKSLRKFKMKEERNITLTLDKAKEWYNKGGELKEIALQAFTKMELNPLPKSWEEYCRKYGYACLSTRYTNLSLKYDALIKLEQLRDCWWNDWRPKYNCGTKYVIKWDKDDLIVATSGRIRAFLIFPTREMAEEFLECFRDLIEQAGDLI